MDLHFVTGNKNKVKEAEDILGIALVIHEIELPEIQSMNLEDVVEEKVRSAYDQVKRPVFVDDVGMYINTWNGFPGPFAKFLLEAGGCELLLQMMQYENNRSVIARDVIGYHDGQRIHFFTGEIKGDIATEIRGSEGWGWDSIFIPLGSKKTLAELGVVEKNKISHRKHALKKFKEYLLSNA